MHKSKYLLLLTAILIIGTVLQACAPAKPAEAVTLKLAVLPIIDTLPMYVAEQEGLFAKNNVEVEFVPVSSAPERDQLLAAAQADGAVNETQAVILFNKEKTQMQIVRYALRPAEGSGHFFILASKASGITTAEGLKNIEIGVSQGTVIEYVTQRLLEAQGLTTEEIKTIAVPKIADRMALLASGELNAGTMPDPLAYLAVGQGATIVLDDSKYPQYGYSVISFRKEVIDAHPETIKGFLAAIEEATNMINADPAKYANLLSEKKLVPEPLLTTYKAPLFPAAGVPTEAEYADALAWMKEKGIIEVDPAYGDAVNASFLP